jgi:glutathione reductase (NADPH)
MKKDYDLIVLGTGGAGYRVAMACKKAGWSVGVVEDDVYGGTCSVSGCIPKKVLSGIATIAEENRQLQNLGILEKIPGLSWGNMIKHKKKFTDSVPQSTLDGLKEAGIDVYHGAPKFIGKMEIRVGSHIITAKKVHIAVGAKPAKLPIEGFDYLVNTDEFLELQTLPKEIIFAGGGYVSFEFAHIASRFGSKVTILQADDKPLNMFDPEIVQILIDASQDIGIKIELNSMIESIRKNGDKYHVYTMGDKKYSSDMVVHGLGRPPAVSDMDLEIAGIDYDSRLGVLVNDYLQSVSNPDVYAGGDAASSGPPLSPVSRLHGNIVTDNLLGKKSRVPDYSSTSSVAFTIPPIAKVGLLVSEAETKGYDFDVVDTDLSDWFDSKRMNLKFAHSRVLVEKGTNKILGAHLIGNHAEDLINIFSLAIENELATDQIKKPIFAFPTPSDDMRSMF